MHTMQEHNQYTKADILHTAENPCDNADCDSSTLCLLSPNPEGFSCLCTDDDADCIGIYRVLV